MAENKIVGFEIKIKGQKDIFQTTKVLGLLNTQMILISNTLKVLDKQGGVGLKGLSKEFKKTGSSAKQLGGVVKGSFDSFKKGNKVVKDLGNGYIEVTDKVDKTAKEFKELEKVKDKDNKTTKDLIKRNKELKKTLLDQPLGKQSKEVKELTKEYSKNNDTIKEFRKELRTGKKASEAAEGSLDQLRKQAIKLKKQYNALGTAQQKTFEGKKIQKALRATQSRIQKLDKAVRDGRSSIGLYGNATKKLARTILTLSVGREIIRGLFTGLAGIVEKNKDIDGSAKSISQSFEKLKDAATKFGLIFLKVVAAPLELFVNLAEGASKAIFGVGFEAEKASVGVRDLQNEFNAEIEVLKRGNISTDARKQLIADINTKYGEYLPNLLSETASLEEITTAQNAANKAFEKKITLLASEEQFIDITKRRLDALREESAIRRTISENEKALNDAIEANVTSFKSGVNTAAESAKQNLSNTTQRLAANELLINQINEEKKALDEVIKGEGINTADFVSNQEVKTDTEKKEIAKRASARQKARDKEAEDLKKDRAALLEQIRNESLARIQLAVDLGKQLTDLQISLIEDGTERALAAERERFAREKEQREANFLDRIKTSQEHEDELIRLFGDNSKEVIDFRNKADEELRQLSILNDKIAERQEKNHQDALLKIQKDATDVLAAAEQKSLDDTLARRKTAKEKLRALRLKRIEEEKADEAKADEERKARNAATKDALVGLVNTVFSAISDISNIAFAAENARFEAAIETRQANISNLNEDLQNATGLQKKFLEIQVEQQQAALAKETKAKEAALKEQAKVQQGIAIGQAIVAAALGIANAFTLPPPASFIAAAATAIATGVQIAVIASQKFAKGGVLSGPSHAQGGIPTAQGEMEGGEAVINKVSTNRHRALLSAINVDGGGRKFAVGGITGAPISAPAIGNATTDVNTRFNQFIDATLAMTAATSKRIDNLNVNLDLNNLEDVQKNDATLEALTTFS